MRCHEQNSGSRPDAEPDLLEPVLKAFPPRALTWIKDQQIERFRAIKELVRYAVNFLPTKVPAV
jgi:hypothetical protein